MSKSIFSYFAPIIPAFHRSLIKWSHFYKSLDRVDSCSVASVFSSFYVQDGCDLNRWTPCGSLVIISYLASKQSCSCLQDSWDTNLNQQTRRRFVGAKYIRRRIFISASSWSLLRHVYFHLCYQQDTPHHCCRILIVYANYNYDSLSVIVIEPYEWPPVAQEISI